MTIYNHHAYLIKASPSDLAVVQSLAQEILGAEIARNPDYFEVVREGWGIDDSRYVSDLQLEVPIGERKVITFFFEDITREAQNALLKSLEDPSGHTTFLVSTPFPDKLIPTLRSRLLTHDIALSPPEEKKKEVKKFIKLTIPERLLFIKDKLADASRYEIESFLESVQIEFHDSHKEDPKYAWKLEELEKVRKYGFSGSIPKKSLLEHIALVL